MTVEILTLPKIRDVYRNQMEYDFPADERKPLRRIEASLKKGQYICYGLKDGTGILAYAFFVVIENQYLLDYFAVRKELRGAGIGSGFLRELLSRQLKDASCVLLEVDDPSAADSDEERVVRNRRLHFYLKNNLQDTGIRVSTFGVIFLILEPLTGHRHSAEEISQIYSRIYRSILPERMYSRMVHLI